MAKHSSSASHHRSEKVMGKSRKKATTSNPLTDVWIYLVVFLGGFCGTAVRYLAGKSLNNAPYSLDIHWGTLLANITACFLYALFAAILTGTLNHHSASAQAHRAGELLSRGLGMGFCGGLSTMSTLAVEITANNFGWAYASISVVLGIVCALVGAALGSLVGGVKPAPRRSKSKRRH